MGAGYVEVVCARNRFHRALDEPEPRRAVVGRMAGFVVGPWRDGRATSCGLPGGAGPRTYRGGPHGAQRAAALQEPGRSRRRRHIGARLRRGKGRPRRASGPRRALCAVVTPHLGEAARLTAPQGEASQGPLGPNTELARFAQKLAELYGATVVLKGPDTYIACAKNPPETARRRGARHRLRNSSAGQGRNRRRAFGHACVSSRPGSSSPSRPPSSRRRFTPRAGCVAARRLTEVSVCATDRGQVHSAGRLRRSIGSRRKPARSQRAGRLKS